MFEVYTDSRSLTKININTSAGTTNQNCSGLFFYVLLQEENGSIISSSCSCIFINSTINI